jgi:hypothetical protein
MKRAILTAALLLIAGAFVATPQTNTFCSNNLPCTVNGLWNFAGGLQSGGVGVATLPINLAGGSGVVTGTLPGANYAAVNLAGGNTNGGVSGILPVANEGTGSPVAGQYVDGGTGAWTALPSSSGSTVLNAQGGASPITGTGSVATVFTYTLPGGTVANLKALRVTVGWTHSTGSASVSYNVTLNGVTSGCNASASITGPINCAVTFLNTGSTTGDSFSTSTVTGAAAAVALTGLAWSSSQVLKFTFNVANTDQVTPILWLVEVVQ